MGGIVRAIDTGYPQQEIADAAYRYQLMDDRGEKVVVGVNKYVMTDEQPVDYLTHRRRRSSTSRSSGWAASRPRATRPRSSGGSSSWPRRAASGDNVMPVLVDAVKDYVSLGEISDVYRQVFGLYREPIIF